MLLKGENIPSSEGFPGQEDSSVEDRFLGFSTRKFRIKK